MSIEIVKNYFKKWNIDGKIMEFPASSATVALAAAAVGCEEKRIAKTLAFLVDRRAILVVVAGDAKVDNVKYKAIFHKKPKMLSPDELTEMVGHPMGGVCPFGIKDGVDVYLDESIRRFETVFPACGSGNSAIELTIAELEKYSRHCGWVDICKDWR